jgi:hypothetical protein
MRREAEEEWAQSDAEVLDEPTQTYCKSELTLKGRYSLASFMRQAT